MMNRRTLIHAAAAMAVATWVAVPQAALAADEAPDALVKRLSVDVLETLRKDKSIKAGDVDRIMALVDKTIMPHVNFRRMTAASVGPGWRKATPEQQARLVLSSSSPRSFRTAGSTHPPPAAADRAAPRR